MTCPYACDDAAYMLGALAPAERHRYEEHLSGCDSCSAAVRELAGLPGLLARLPAHQVATLEADGAGPAVPDTLLPALVRRVGRERRRSRLRIGLAAGVAAASVAVGGVLAVQHLTRPESPPYPTIQLQAVGGHPVHGTARLIPWTWGTTIRLTCYPLDSGGSSGEIYTLYAIDPSGRYHVVSTWQSRPEDVTIPGGTALPTDDVMALEVRDDHQEVVMQGTRG